MQPQFAAVDGEAIVGAFDADGLHGYFCEPADDQADAGHRFMNVTVRAACSFGKDDDATSAFDEAQHFHDAGGIGVLLVDGDDVAVREGPVEDFAVHQGFACQKVHWVFKKLPDHGRVKEALVIDDVHAGSLLDELLPVDDLEIEKPARYGARCLVAEEVNRIHVHD